jgi:hypothetical protein
MALEARFGELTIQLANLREALLGLQTTSREDKPADDDAVLVDVFGDAAEDLLGWAEGAFLAAVEAHQSAQHPTDLQRTWRGLTICQERVQQISQRLMLDLLCYERIAELTRFGRRRGGEWQAWARSVRGALNDCQQPLFTTGQAIFACWQEIGERIGFQSISVQAMATGQQVTLAERAKR